MFKFLFFIFAFGIAANASAQAMPFHQPQSDLIVPVSSGCGLGVHRGPYDGCFPMYGGYYGGPYRGYRNAYYVGAVSGGVCGGRGTRTVCTTSNGMCWVTCN
jgi:hypothetical protein